MRKNVVFPFKVIRPDSEALTAGQWFRTNKNRTNDRLLESGDGLEDWSYDTPLHLGREISLDLEAIAHDIGLIESSPSFELIHTIKISSLGIRKCLHKRQLPYERKVHDLFIGRLDSESLCEEITLSSSIVLGHDLQDVASWAPSRKGSICWQDETRIHLEGYGSRFPMQDIPFSEQHALANGANWHLDWRPGLLHYSFNSAVTLYLNSEKPNFLIRIQTGDEQLIEEVMASVMAQICGFLLIHTEEFDDEHEFPEGSLGKIAQGWLLSALPGQTLREIKSEFERMPARVHTALRALAGNNL